MTPTLNTLKTYDKLRAALPHLSEDDAFAAAQLLASAEVVPQIEVPQLPSLGQTMANAVAKFTKGPRYTRNHSQPKIKWTQAAMDYLLTAYSTRSLGEMAWHLSNTMGLQNVTEPRVAVMVNRLRKAPETTRYEGQMRVVGGNRP